MSRIKLLRTSYLEKGSNRRPRKKKTNVPDKKPSQLPRVHVKKIIRGSISVKNQRE
jgi:hypothetical protein